jgi:hypothetical protein
MKFEFSRNIFEKELEYQLSSKSVQWDSSCSMRTDGQADERMTKLIVAFRNFEDRNFENAPKNHTHSFVATGKNLSEQQLRDHIQ